MSHGNIFVLNLRRSLIDLSSLRIKTYADLYTLLGTSCENWNVFRVDLSGQVHNLCLVSRILNTNVYLLFKEISRDEGPW